MQGEVREKPETRILRQPGPCWKAGLVSGEWEPARMEPVPVPAPPESAAAKPRRVLDLVRVQRRPRLQGLVLGGLVVLAALLLWGFDSFEISWSGFPLALVVVAAGVAARGVASPGLGLGAVAVAAAVASESARAALLIAVAGAVLGGLVALWADAVERRRDRWRGFASIVLVVLGATTAALLAQRLLVWLPQLSDLVRTLVVGVVAALATLAGRVLLDRSGGTRAGAASATLEAASWAVGGLLSPSAVVAPVLALVAAIELLATRRAAAVERRRGRELERLSRAGERLSRGPSDLDDAVASIWRELRHAVAIEWFHLEVVASGREGLEWAGDPDGALLAGRPQPPALPPALPGIHRRTGWRVVEHELEAEGRPLAVVRLWCDPRRLGREGVEMVERLLPQLGARLHRGVLGKEAREDPLTGAVFRRVFERRLVESFERSAERGEAMSVALVDLDFFKRVNDVYGHAAGDQALIHAAAVLRSRLRDEDLCARWGGEEFALLLDGLAKDEALLVVERLRSEIAALPIWFEGERLPVTMSGGVATFPGLFVSSGKELLELADQALYAAKANGRNRVLAFLGPGHFGAPDGEELREGTPEARVMPRLFV